MGQRVILDTRTAGEAFATVGLARDSASYRVLAETEPVAYGAKDVAARRAGEIAMERGWTIVDVSQRCECADGEWIVLREETSAETGRVLHSEQLATRRTREAAERVAAQFAKRPIAARGER